MTIDILVKIYNKWGETNNLDDLGSAEEEMCRPNLTTEQYEWLEKFIEVWDHMVTKRRGF